MHLGVISSPGKWCTCTRSSSLCKSKPDSSDQPPVVHCSIFQFCCSHAYCWQWTSQRGHSEPYVDTQPHMRQAVMHCMFRKLSAVSRFSAVCATVALLWDWTARVCAQDPIPYHLLALYHFVGTYHCRVTYTQNT